MDIFNGESRSSKFGPVVENSKFENKPRRLGDVAGFSRGYGVNPVTTCREDSDGRNTFASKERGDTQVNGKALDQLVDEVSKEIAYHKTQVGQLENRLNELRQLSGELKEINNSD